MKKKAYRDRTFHKLLKRALLLPIALMGCLAVLLLKQSGQLSSMSDRIMTTGAAVESVRQVQGLVLDMETGMRGYLLEGDRTFLQPYNLAKPQLGLQLSNLKRLVADSSGQSLRVKELEKRIQIWVDYADRKITPRGGIFAINPPALQNDRDGKALVDSLRLQISEIIDDEKRLLESQNFTAQSAQKNIVLSIAGGTLILALILAIFARNQLAFLSARYEKAIHSEEERSKQLEVAQLSAENLSEEVVAILEGMQDGFIETDSDWNIIRVNRAQEQTSKLERVEMVGKNLWDLFPESEEDSSKHWINFNLARDEAVSMQFEELYLPLMTWNEYAVYPRKGGGVSIFSRDITERKRAEEALADQVRSLEKERAMREIFVSTLSHDLRNPIATIQMSSKLMIDDPEIGLFERHQLTSIILNSSLRANRMIENLLDANRIKSGESIPLHIDKKDLRIVTTETVADLSLFYGRRFALNVSDNDFQGYWSEDGIKRMLENLCTNAIKYGDSNGAITISLSGSKESVRISVHNQGNPLTDEEQVKIFEPFQRSRSAQESGQQGWGLGLTLVQGITHSLGGKLKLESSLRDGTTFTICLPWDSRVLSQDKNSPFYSARLFA